MGKNSENDQVLNLIPVTEWSNHHAWPPIGGLRHLIFHENNNGFHKCVYRVGKRVLINEPEFFKWVTDQSANNRHVDTDA